MASSELDCERATAENICEDSTTNESSRRFHREVKTASTEISSPFPSAFQNKSQDLELQKKKREEYKVQEKELEAIHAVFNIYDVYREGKIDGSQVPDALRALGLNPTLGLVEKIAGGIKSGEQGFTVEEFVPIYAKVKSDKDNGVYEDFIECLKLYDKQQDGLMPLGELTHALTSLGERLNPDELDAVLTDCMDEENDDGLIPYIPFLARMCEKPVPKTIRPE